MWTCQSLITLSYISVPTGHYSTQGSRTTRCGQHGSTFRIHSYAQSVYSFVRLYDRDFGWLTCCLFFNQKYDLEWGLYQLREVERLRGGWGSVWDSEGWMRIRLISCGWGSVWETDTTWLWVTSPNLNITISQTYVKPQSLDQLEE